MGQTAWGRMLPAGWLVRGEQRLCRCLWCVGGFVGMRMVNMVLGTTAITPGGVAVLRRRSLSHPCSSSVVNIERTKSSSSWFTVWPIFG
jgi:hypothetical protein